MIRSSSLDFFIALMTSATIVCPCIGLDKRLDKPPKSARSSTRAPVGFRSNAVPDCISGGVGAKKRILNSIPKKRSSRRLAATLRRNLNSRPIRLSNWSNVFLIAICGFFQDW